MFQRTLLHELIDPGVDLILPDYTYVLENADKLRGIVITHGHEDHTGTLPYLMKDLDRNVPIYGTKMTLGLIEGKFAEHKIKNAKLVEIKEREHLANINEIKGEQMQIAWGSQIRSYVFMPYTLAKDHRTGFEMGNINAVMDGDIDGFINAYLKAASLGTLGQVD